MSDVTDRDRRVLDMRAAGDSRRKIADEFGISQRRVQQIEEKAKRESAFACKQAEVEQRLKEVDLEPSEEAVIRLYWKLGSPEGTRDNLYVRQHAMEKLGVSYD